MYSHRGDKLGVVRKVQECLVDTRCRRSPSVLDDLTLICCIHVALYCTAGHSGTPHCTVVHHSTRRALIGVFLTRFTARVLTFAQQMRRVTGDSHIQ